MSVTFHKSKEDGLRVLAVLEPGEIEVLNKALEAHKTGYFIDAYGDAKLSGSHIMWIMALPVGILAREARTVFEGMRNFEVEYVRGV